MSDWNTKIVEEFRANGGKVGGPFEGAPMILVHHLGRKSGTERVNPLVYFPDGGSMVIIASAGGAPKHPDWYHNLAAVDRTTVEVGTETFEASVAEIEGDERAALWEQIKTAMPGFAEYEKTANRTIPLFRLQRVPARV
ncbi:MAG TPA: nitroreductase family deazaflavin-dependent oxidoreductase [Kineosporiaceae bacterium]|jgi:deazaflavin-dependent oxidoreductase (nitroreductase family)|nr:nitroreductase family deazaflavin-dependent oxidoreductase [Kineosporiaceae bacterium]